MPRLKRQLRRLLIAMGTMWAFHYAIYNDTWLEEHWYWQLPLFATSFVLIVCTFKYD